MWFKRDARAQTPAVPSDAPAEAKGLFARVWEALNKPVFDQDEAWAIKTRERIAKTRQVLMDRVMVLIAGRGHIDDDLLESLEEILLGADVGVETTEALLQDLRRRAREDALVPSQIPTALAQFLAERLGGAAPLQVDPNRLNVLMIVGVNGVGKTTTIGKLAWRFEQSGLSTLIAAGDTFRAAAIEQLAIWAERAGVELVKHQSGADAAAVVYDAIQAARARGKKVLLVDTAGRLHNKANLMEELRKVRRIIEREASDAAVQVLLVLDATTGQNGVRQASVFQEATGLTGVILTKLDGTAKGGVIFSIRDALGLPVQVVGLGEGLNDIGDFEPQAFVEGLFGQTPGT